MTTEIAPSTPEDIRAFFPRAVPWRVRALTVRVDGEIVGIGGWLTREDGVKFAFVEASEEACRKHPLVLHKAAKRVLSDAKAAGIVKLMACCDRNREAAARWLKRLGFIESGMSQGESIWQWQR